MEVGFEFGVVVGLFYVTVFVIGFGVGLGY